MGGGFTLPFVSKEHVRILMVGMDASGKTSILYSLKLGEIIETFPSLGFNVEEVVLGNAKFTIWDVGGRGKMRSLYLQYYANASALIYVVDSNYREGLEEARDELHATLQEEKFPDIPVLIFFNKQDLPNALSVEELIEYFQLRSLTPIRPWHAQGTSISWVEGYREGLTWLSRQLEKKASGTLSSFSTPSATSLLPSWLVSSQDKPEKDAAETEVSVFSAAGKKYAATSLDSYPSDQDFLTAFETKEKRLSSQWTHLDLIRVIYKSLKQLNGAPRRDAVSYILDGCKALSDSAIAEGMGKDWYHTTTIYFWIQIVDFCLRQVEATSFQQLCEACPAVTNNDFIFEFYSTAYLHGTLSPKKEFFLPDKKPLPSIIRAGEKAAS